MSRESVNVMVRIVTDVSGYGGDGLSETRIEEQVPIEDRSDLSDVSGLVERLANEAVGKTRSQIDAQEALAEARAPAVAERDREEGGD